MNTAELRCDGCGQLASPEHIARRLQRLEWSTRFRPVHIGTLLLGAAAPQNDSEFIYSPAGGWTGEGRLLLGVAGVTLEGKPAEAALAEFQRGGFFLTHVLECPVEDSQRAAIAEFLRERLPAALTRIRRSLKPKKLAPIARSLKPFLPTLASAELPCAIVLDRENPFALDADLAPEAAERLRNAVAMQSVHASG